MDQNIYIESLETGMIQFYKFRGMNVHFDHSLGLE
jgi:hypothetical protein